jgi:hypothetical protein
MITKHTVKEIEELFPDDTDDLKQLLVDLKDIGYYNSLKGRSDKLLNVMKKSLMINWINI